MFKNKAILTVAAAATLFMFNPGQDQAHAASISPSVQEKVYVYQGTDINEINRIIENFNRSFGNDQSFANYRITQKTVKQPVPTETTVSTQQPTQTETTAPVQQQPAQTETTTPVQQQPVVADQPTTTQTSSTLSAYEQKVVDLTNQQRAKNGLPALKIDLTLSKVAHEKSRDMSANGYFSHTSPTYGSPFDMMKQYGITYRYAGENIAMGQRTPEEVVTAWMNSEGHRKNILSPNFTHIGVGYVSQGNYWTQEFIGK